MVSPLTQRGELLASFLSLGVDKWLLAGGTPLAPPFFKKAVKGHIGPMTRILRDP